MGRKRTAPKTENTKPKPKKETVKKDAVIEEVKPDTHAGGIPNPQVVGNE